MALRPLNQSALAGIAEASARFERSAAKVARLAGAPSAAQTAETVEISAEAREIQATEDSVTTAGLEGAMVDTRVAKYAFIANLRVLQTGAEVAEAASELVKRKG